MLTKEAVIQELLDKYDADDLVDILNIDAEELLARFEDKVEAYIPEEEDDEDDTD
jgi:hypothetical protein